MDPVTPKRATLRERVRACGSVLVAFSGGVDSTLVALIASQELGPKAVALTALSASVSPEERADATALATRMGVRHILVDSHELSNPSYAKNPVNRCYFCKTELYELCERERVGLGLDRILDGFNADDFKDHRPGHQAAREHRVFSPLADAGLTKDEIRAWSHELGLPTWDKPQMACLASRIPYGTAVTEERLSRIAGAESALRALGLRHFRVRFHGDVARIEAGAEEQARFASPEFREAVDQAVKAQGFTFVALDLEPFRSGRLNDAAPV